jgi:hypothetical protein
MIIDISPRKDRRRCPSDNRGGPFLVVVPCGTTHSLSLVSHKGLYIGVAYNPKEVTGEEISKRKLSGDRVAVDWFTHTLSQDHYFRDHDYGTCRPKMTPMTSE